MHSKSKNRDEMGRRGCQYNAHLEGIALTFSVFTVMNLLPVFNLEKRKRDLCNPFEIAFFKVIVFVPLCILYSG